MPWKLNGLVVLLFTLPGFSYTANAQSPAGGLSCDQIVNLYINAEAMQVAGDSQCGAAYEKFLFVAKNTTCDEDMYVLSRRKVIANAALKLKPCKKTAISELIINSGGGGSQASLPEPGINITSPGLGTASGIDPTLAFRLSKYRLLQNGTEWILVPADQLAIVKNESPVIFNEVMLVPAPSAQNE